MSEITTLRCAHPFEGPPASLAMPGIRATVDGSSMVAWVETRISEVACAYPITSSQTMGQAFQAEVAAGKRNLWGQPLTFIEPESEHSAQSACEGAALAGARVTNFTSGQGLILMKEVLYVLSGKRLPMVLHVGSRALTSHALNVHCGHDDVMGVADAGWGMLFARHVQDVGDLALVARRVYEETGIPFMVIQDGFLTTHTLETCFLPEPDLMRDFVGDPRARIENLFDPARPLLTGPVQNQDAYMKGKIAQREFYAVAADRIRAAMRDLGDRTGRKLDLVLTHRLDDAEYAIVALGTAYETATVAADYLRGARGLKVGCLHLASFRPFPGPDIARLLGRLKGVAVIERLDTPLAESNALTAEVKAALADAASGHPEFHRIDRVPPVFSAAAGLGGRDIRVSDLIAAVEQIAGPGRPRFFTLGIPHPLNAEPTERPVIRPRGAFSLRGHSVGGWGSITTNKILASVVGELFGLHVQAYPKYGSEKKGLPTSYFLTLAQEPIRTHQEPEVVDFVAVHDPSTLLGPDPFSGLLPGGWAFIQSALTDPAGIAASLPAVIRGRLRDLDATLIAIDASRIARELAPRPDLQRRMQGIVLLGALLRVLPFRNRDMTTDRLLEAVSPALQKFFGRRGGDVVRANLEAVRRGLEETLMVPLKEGPRP
jgi:pyruvate-ferredoxin/flavodoxin oxidoreductase